MNLSGTVDIEYAETIMTEDEVKRYNEFIDVLTHIFLKYKNQLSDKNPKEHPTEEPNT